MRISPTTVQVIANDLFAVDIKNHHLSLLPKVWNNFFFLSTSEVSGQTKFVNLTPPDGQSRNPFCLKIGTKSSRD